MDYSRAIGNPRIADVRIAKTLEIEANNEAARRFTRRKQGAYPNWGVR